MAIHRPASTNQMTLSTSRTAPSSGSGCGDPSPNAAPAVVADAPWPQRPIASRAMDLKLELVAVPVSDVDRAKAFYTDQVGFNADHDHQVTEDLRFVQLTPPGSACSIAIGTGIVEAEPGSAQGLQLVV